MKYFFTTIIFCVLTTCSFAQKSYMIHLSMDRIYFGTDSVVFKGGKTFLLEVKSQTDTLEFGRVGVVPIAMLVNVTRMKVGEQIKYEISYSFFKKENLKWVLIRKFPDIERYELSEMSPALEKAGIKKSAHEEYHCSVGQPEVFEAYFRMDVYKK